VALGRGGDIVEGPARIATSDDKWQSLIANLAIEATFLVMVPLARPGTFWELRWLAEQHLLGKTLMVMPETVRPMPPGVVATTQESDRFFEDGIQRWNPEAHALDLPTEWRKATQAAREIGIELPPPAAVGALFTIDAETRRVAKIMPLALSTLARRVGYLRAVITAMELFKASPNPPPDLTSALARAVFYRGGTLEFTLMRAADGLLLWGDATSAAVLLDRAASEGAPQPRFVQSYLEELPKLVQSRSENGDREAVIQYKAGIPILLGHPKIAALAPEHLVEQVSQAAI